MKVNAKRFIERVAIGLSPFLAIPVHATFDGAKLEKRSRWDDQYPIWYCDRTAPLPPSCFESTQFQKILAFACHRKAPWLLGFWSQQVYCLWDSDQHPTWVGQMKGHWHFPRWDLALSGTQFNLFGRGGLRQAYQNQRWSGTLRWHCHKRFALSWEEWGKARRLSGTWRVGCRWQLAVAIESTTKPFKAKLRLALAQQASSDHAKQVLESLDHLLLAYQSFAGQHPSAPSVTPCARMDSEHPVHAPPASAVQVAHPLQPQPDRRPTDRHVHSATVRAPAGISDPPAPLHCAQAVPNHVVGDRQTRQDSGTPDSGSGPFKVYSMLATYCLQNPHASASQLLEHVKIAGQNTTSGLENADDPVGIASGSLSNSRREHHGETPPLQMATCDAVPRQSSAAQATRSRSSGRIVQGSIPNPAAQNQTRQLLQQYCIENPGASTREMLAFLNTVKNHSASDALCQRGRPLNADLTAVGPLGSEAQRNESRALSSNSDSTRATERLPTPSDDPSGEVLLASYHSSQDNFPVLDIAAPDAQGISFNRLRGTLAESLLTGLHVPDENHEAVSLGTSGLILNNTVCHSTTRLGAVVGNRQLDAANTPNKIILAWPAEKTGTVRRLIAGQLVVSGPPTQVVLCYPGDIWVDGLVLSHITDLSIFSGALDPRSCHHLGQPVGRLHIAEKGIWDHADHQDCGHRVVHTKMLRLKSVQLIAKQCAIAGPLLARKKQFVLGEASGFFNLLKASGAFPIQVEWVKPSGPVGEAPLKGLTVGLDSAPQQPLCRLQLDAFAPPLPLKVEENQEANLDLFDMNLISASALAVNLPVRIPGKFRAIAPSFKVPDGGALACAEMDLQTDHRVTLTGPCYFEKACQIRSRQWVINALANPTSIAATEKLSGYLGWRAEGCGAEQSAATALLEVDQGFISPGATCLLPNVEIRGYTKAWSQHLCVQGKLLAQGRLRCQASQLDLHGQISVSGGSGHLSGGHLNSFKNSLLSADRSLILSALSGVERLRVLAEGRWHAPRLTIFGPVSLQTGLTGAFDIPHLLVQKESDVLFFGEMPLALALRTLEVKKGSTLSFETSLHLHPLPGAQKTRVVLAGALKCDELKAFAPILLRNSSQLFVKNLHLFRDQRALIFQDTAPILQGNLSLHLGAEVFGMDRWVLVDPKRDIPTETNTPSSLCLTIGGDVHWVGEGVFRSRQLVLEDHRRCIAESNLTVYAETLRLGSDTSMQVKGCCRFEKNGSVDCEGQFTVERLVIAKNVEVHWSKEKDALKGVKDLILEPGAKLYGVSGVERIAARSIQVAEGAQILIDEKPAIIGRSDGLVQKIICLSDQQSWIFQGAVDLAVSEMHFRALRIEARGSLSCREPLVHLIGERLSLAAGAQLCAQGLRLTIAQAIETASESQLHASENLTIHLPEAPSSDVTMLFTHAGEIQTPRLAVYGKGVLQSIKGQFLAVKHFQLCEKSDLTLKSLALEAENIHLEGDLQTLACSFHAKQAFYLGGSGGLSAITYWATTPSGQSSDFKVRSPRIFLRKGTHVRCKKFDVESFHTSLCARQLHTAGSVDCEVADVAVLQWLQTGQFSVHSHLSDDWENIQSFRQYQTKNSTAEPKLILHADEWKFKGKIFRNEAGLVHWGGQKTCLILEEFSNTGDLKSGGEVQLQVPIDKITGLIQPGIDKLVQLRITTGKALLVDQLKLLASWTHQLSLTLAGLEGQTGAEVVLNAGLELDFRQHSYRHQMHLSARTLSVKSEQAIGLLPRSAFKAHHSSGGSENAALSLRAATIDLHPGAQLLSIGRLHAQANEKLISDGGIIKAQKSIALRARTLILENHTDLSMEPGAMASQETECAEMDADVLHCSQSTLRSQQDLKLQVRQEWRCQASELSAKQCLSVTSSSGQIVLDNSQLIGYGHFCLQRAPGSLMLTRIEPTLHWTNTHVFGTKNLSVILPGSAIQFNQSTLKAYARIHLTLRNLCIEKGEILGNELVADIEHSLENKGKIAAAQSMILKAGVALSNILSGQILSNALIRLIAPQVLNTGINSILRGGEVREVISDRTSAVASISTLGGSCDECPAGIQIFSDNLLNFQSANIVNARKLRTPPRPNHPLSAENIFLFPYRLSSHFKEVLKALPSGASGGYTLREILSTLRKILRQVEPKPRLSHVTNSAAAIQSQGQIIILSDTLLNEDPGLSVPLMPAKVVGVEPYYEYTQGGEVHRVWAADVARAQKISTPTGEKFLGKVVEDDRTGAQALHIEKNGVTDKIILKFTLSIETRYAQPSAMLATRAALLEAEGDLWVNTGQKVVNSGLLRSLHGHEYFLDFGENSYTSEIWLDNRRQPIDVTITYSVIERTDYDNLPRSNRAQQVGKAVGVGFTSAWLSGWTWSSVALIASNPAIGVACLGAGLLIGGSAVNHCASEDVPDVCYTPCKEKQPPVRTKPQIDKKGFSDASRLKNIWIPNPSVDQQVELPSYELIKSRCPNLFKPSDELTQLIKEKIRQTPQAQRLVRVEQAVYQQTLQGLESALGQLFYTNRSIPQSVTAKTEALWAQVREDSLFTKPLIHYLLDLVRTIPNDPEKSLANVIENTIGLLSEKEEGANRFTWEALVMARENESLAFQQHFSRCIKTMPYGPAEYNPDAFQLGGCYALQKKGFSLFCDTIFAILLDHPDWRKNLLLHQHQLGHCQTADVFHCWRCAFEMLGAFLLRGTNLERTCSQRLLDSLKAQIKAHHRSQQANRLSLVQCLLASPNSTNPIFDLDTLSNGMSELFYYLSERSDESDCITSSTVDLESFQALIQSFCAQVQQQAWHCCGQLQPQKTLNFCPYQCILGQKMDGLIPFEGLLRAQLQQWIPKPVTCPQCGRPPDSEHLSLTLPKTLVVMLSCTARAALQAIPLRIDWPIEGTHTPDWQYGLSHVVLSFPGAAGPIRLVCMESQMGTLSPQKFYYLVPGQAPIVAQLSGGCFHFTVDPDQRHWDYQPRRDGPVSRLASHNFLVSGDLTMGICVVYLSKHRDHPRVSLIRSRENHAVVQPHAADPTGAQSCQVLQTYCRSQGTTDPFVKHFDAIFEQSLVYQRHQLELRVTSAVAEGLARNAKHIPQLNLRWVEPSIEPCLASMFGQERAHAISRQRGEYLRSEAQMADLADFYRHKAIKNQQEAARCLRDQLAMVCISGKKGVEFETITGNIQNKALICSEVSIQVNNAREVSTESGAWVSPKTNLLTKEGMTFSNESLLESETSRLEVSAAPATESTAAGEAHPSPAHAMTVTGGSAVRVEKNLHLKAPNIDLAGKQEKGAGSTPNPSEGVQPVHNPRQGVSATNGKMHGEGNDGAIETSSFATQGITSSMRHSHWQNTRIIHAQHERSGQTGAAGSLQVGSQGHLEMHTQRLNMGAGKILQGERQPPSQVPPEAQEAENAALNNVEERLEKTCDSAEVLEKCRKATKKLSKATALDPGQSVTERVHQATHHVPSQLLTDENCSVEVGSFPAAPVQQDTERPGIFIYAKTVHAEATTVKERTVIQTKREDRFETRTFRTFLDDLYEACVDIFQYASSTIHAEEQKKWIEGLSERDQIKLKAIMQDQNQAFEKRLWNQKAEPERFLQVVGASLYLVSAGCLLYNNPVELITRFTFTLDKVSEYCQETQITESILVQDRPVISAEGQLVIHASDAFTATGIEMQAHTAKLKAGCLELLAAKNVTYEYLHRSIRRFSQSVSIHRLLVAFDTGGKTTEALQAFQSEKNNTGSVSSNPFDEQMLADASLYSADALEEKTEQRPRLAHGDARMVQSSIKAGKDLTMTVQGNFSCQTEQNTEKFQQLNRSAAENRHAVTAGFEQIPKSAADLVRWFKVAYTYRRAGGSQGETYGFEEKFAPEAAGCFAQNRVNFSVGGHTTLVGAVILGKKSAEKDHSYHFGKGITASSLTQYGLVYLVPNRTIHADQKPFALHINRNLCEKLLISGVQSWQGYREKGWSGLCPSGWVDLSQDMICDYLMHADNDSLEQLFLHWFGNKAIQAWAALRPTLQAGTEPQALASGCRAQSTELRSAISGYREDQAQAASPCLQGSLNHRCFSDTSGHLISPSVFEQLDEKKAFVQQGPWLMQQRTHQAKTLIRNKRLAKLHTCIDRFSSSVSMAKASLDAYQDAQSALLKMPFDPSARGFRGRMGPTRLAQHLALPSRWSRIGINACLSLHEQWLLSDGRVKPFCCKAGVIGASQLVNWVRQASAVRHYKAEKKKLDLGADPPGYRKKLRKQFQDRTERTEKMIRRINTFLLGRNSQSMLPLAHAFGKLPNVKKIEQKVAQAQKSYASAAAAKLRSHQVFYAAKPHMPGIFEKIGKEDFDVEWINQISHWMVPDEETKQQIQTWCAMVRSAHEQLQALKTAFEETLSEPNRQEMGHEDYLQRRAQEELDQCRDPGLRHVVRSELDAVLQDEAIAQSYPKILQNLVKCLEVIRPQSECQANWRQFLRTMVQYYTSHTVEFSHIVHAGKKDTQLVDAIHDYFKVLAIDAGGKARVPFVLPATIQSEINAELDQIFDQRNQKPIQTEATADNPAPCATIGQLVALSPFRLDTLAPDVVETTIENAFGTVECFETNRKTEQLIQKTLPIPNKNFKAGGLLAKTIVVPIDSKTKENRLITIGATDHPVIYNFLCQPSGAQVTMELPSAVFRPIKWCWENGELQAGFEAYQAGPIEFTPEQLAISRELDIWAPSTAYAYMETICPSSRVYPELIESYRTPEASFTLKVAYQLQEGPEQMSQEEVWELFKLVVNKDPNGEYCSLYNFRFQNVDPAAQAAVAKECKALAKVKRWRDLPMMCLTPMQKNQLIANWEKSLETREQAAKSMDIPTENYSNLEEIKLALYAHKRQGHPLSPSTWGEINAYLKEKEGGDVRQLRCFKHLSEALEGSETIKCLDFTNAWHFRWGDGGVLSSVSAPEYLPFELGARTLRGLVQTTSTSDKSVIWQWTPPGADSPIVVDRTIGNIFLFQTGPKGQHQLLDSRLLNLQLALENERRHAEHLQQDARVTEITQKLEYLRKRRWQYLEEKEPGFCLGLLKAAGQDLLSPTTWAELVVGDSLFWTATNVLTMFQPQAKLPMMACKTLNLAAKWGRKVYQISKGCQAVNQTWSAYQQYRQLSKDNQADPDTLIALRADLYERGYAMLYQVGKAWVVSTTQSNQKIKRQMGKVGKRILDVAGHTRRLEIPTQNGISKITEKTLKVAGRDILHYRVTQESSIAWVDRIIGRCELKQKGKGLKVRSQHFHTQHTKHDVFFCKGHWRLSQKKSTELFGKPTRHRYSVNRKKSKLNLLREPAQKSSQIPTKAILGYVEVAKEIAGILPETSRPDPNAIAGPIIHYSPMVLDPLASSAWAKGVMTQHADPALISDSPGCLQACVPSPAPDEPFTEEDPCRLNPLEYWHLEGLDTVVAPRELETRGADVWVAADEQAGSDPATPLPSDAADPQYPFFDVPSGLSNPDHNKCYLNSVLQCLIQDAVLREHLHALRFSGRPMGSLEALLSGLSVGTGDGRACTFDYWRSLYGTLLPQSWLERSGPADAQGRLRQQCALDCWHRLVENSPAIYAHFKSDFTWKCHCPNPKIDSSLSSILWDSSIFFENFADKLGRLFLAQAAPSPAYCAPCGQSYRCIDVKWPGALCIERPEGPWGSAIPVSLVVRMPGIEAHAKYRLQAMLLYHGNGETGHYEACVRKQERWYRCNDDRVSRIEEIAEFLYRFSQQVVQLTYRLQVPSRS